MSVEPHLARVGEVAAQRDEPGTELRIEQVEVVDGDRPVGFVEGEVDGLAVGALAPLVAHEDFLDLLSSHDGHHPKVALSFRRLEVRADVVKLAIVPAGPVRTLQPEEGDVVVLGEGRKVSSEAVADLLEECRGGDLVTEVLGEEGDDLATHLKVRHVDVQVDAVETIEVERHMSLEHVIDVD
jgi:hypothetical protein